MKMPAVLNIWPCVNEGIQKQTKYKAKRSEWRVPTRTLIEDKITPRKNAKNSCKNGVGNGNFRCDAFNYIFHGCTYAIHVDVMRGDGDNVLVLAKYRVEHG